MNLAAPATRGDVVVILDADDHLVPQWPERLASILNSWPDRAPLCFSACQTRLGDSTVSHSRYTGVLTFDDLLNEKYPGEYLPIFRGDAFRARGYRDPEMPWGCEMWTYLGIAQENDLWISSEVMRIYHYDRPGSVTSNRREASTSSQIMRCHELILKDFGNQFKERAKTQWHKRLLRLAVYSAMAGHRDLAWRNWREAASIMVPLESLAAALSIQLGPNFTYRLVGWSKKFKFIKRFG